MQPLAGHLVEAKISGTAEIFLTKKNLKNFMTKKLALSFFLLKSLYD
jgi:predicted DNA-binding protein with PD1-like motif